MYVLFNFSPCILYLLGEVKHSVMIYHYVIWKLSAEIKSHHYRVNIQMCGVSIFIRCLPVAKTWLDTLFHLCFGVFLVWNFADEVREHSLMFREQEHEEWEEDFKTIHLAYFIFIYLKKFGVNWITAGSVYILGHISDSGLRSDPWNVWETTCAARDRTNSGHLQGYHITSWTTGSKLFLFSQQCRVKQKYFVYASSLFRSP